MISLILSAVLSQVSLPPTAAVPVCKGFSDDMGSALTEDRTPSWTWRYSEYETIDCGSLDSYGAWVVSFAIEYPIFNAIDCARVAPPRVTAFNDRGAPVSVSIKTNWDAGACRSVGIYFPLFGRVRMNVRSQVPQSRLLLGAYDR